MVETNYPDLDEKLFDLEKELESKRQETQDLANIASVITSLLNIESVLAAAMETGIRQVSGEVGAMLQIEEGQPVVKVSWGVDATLLDSLIYRDNLDIIRYCLKEQRLICDNGGQGLIAGHPFIRNFVCCPIFSREEIAGVMIIFNKENEEEFTEKDTLILEMITKFTSVAIENSNLLKESLEKQKMEQELDLAHQVQSTFLPENVSLEGLDIVANYIPARQVGGDYYDLIPIGDDKLFFLVGDVTDKGVPAALVMTSVYSIVRSYVTSYETIDVKTLMSRLNETLCHDVIKGHSMFITLFMAFIDLQKGTLDYCNAGHPPPFYFRASGSETVPLRRGGPIVGQFAGTEYKSTRMDIGRGDRIFCYTDGLIEAANGLGELYGMKRLETYFRNGLGSKAEQFSRDVKNEIDRFSLEGSRESVDDYTTLVIDFAGRVSESNHYEFILASEIRSLEKMHQDIDAIAAEHGIPEKIVHPFRVAVSEAVTNAIVHAHAGDSSKIIRFLVDLNDDRILAVIIDQGPVREWDDLESADPVGQLDAEGGRGLGLIKRLSDEANFQWLPEGGMEVKIVKYLS